MSQSNTYGAPPQNMQVGYPNYMASPANQQSTVYNSQTYSTQASPLYRPISAPSYPIIVGRMVNQVNDIRPNEVPNDGSIAVFPQSDLSCVYVKYLKADGLIATAKYVLDTSVDKTSIPSDEYMALESKLNELISLVKTKNNRPYKPNKRNNPNGTREVNGNVQER